MWQKKTVKDPAMILKGPIYCESKDYICQTISQENVLLLEMTSTRGNITKTTAERTNSQPEHTQITFNKQDVKKHTKKVRLTITVQFLKGI